MIRIAIVLFMIFTTNFAANAQQTEQDYCTYKELDAKLGPVRDQGNKGWCYANAAADLVSYYMYDQLGGRPVSAVFMALANNSLIRPDPNSESGTMRLSIEAGARSRGVCLKSVEDKAMRRGPLPDLNGKILALQNLKLLYDQKNFGGLNKMLNEYKSKGSILADIPANDFDYLLENNSARDFPVAFAEYLCRNDKFNVPWATDLNSKVQTPKGRTLGKPLLTIIDEQLNSDNIVGIGYFANFLTEDGGRKEGGHASVIVGRRRDPVSGKCEYKLRNSWGPGCFGYADSLKNNGKCDRGNLWIDARTLWNNLVSITYIAK